MRSYIIVSLAGGYVRARVQLTPIRLHWIPLFEKLKQVIRVPQCTLNGPWSPLRLTSTTTIDYSLTEVSRWSLFPKHLSRLISDSIVECRCNCFDLKWVTNGQENLLIVTLHHCNNFEAFRKYLSSSEWVSEWIILIKNRGLIKQSVTFLWLLVCYVYSLPLWCFQARRVL